MREKKRVTCVCVCVWLSYTLHNGAKMSLMMEKSKNPCPCGDIVGPYEETNL